MSELESQVALNTTPVVVDIHSETSFEASYGSSNRLNEARQTVLGPRAARKEA